MTPEECADPGPVARRARSIASHRVRYADGAPMARGVHRPSPPSPCPRSRSVGVSLYEAMAATGHRPARALQRLRGGADLGPARARCWA
ncbi:hypothetical protein ACRAWD_20415 [Caulobacter segnis]